MKKNCTNCQNAEFETKPSGKRNLKVGECTFEPLIPHSFLSLRGDMPYKRNISKYTKPDCPCWAQGEIMKGMDIFDNLPEQKHEENGYF